MRRQTIFLAAALAVAMPSTAAITQNRSDARNAVTASRDPSAATARDRLILKIKDARAASYSIAPTDDASMLFGLEEARAPREAGPETAVPLPSAGTKPFAPMPGRARFTALDMEGFAPHVGLAPVYAFEESRVGRVSLNVGPVSTTSYRDGDAQLSPRPGDGTYGSEVSGVAVGFSFKLN
jgi:hypothetical protein